MGSLVRKIPDQLSGLGSASADTYTLVDNEYPYALAGIPFLSGIRDDRPYTERMAEIRKQQFDSFAEPGEQSISGAFWWLRSQSSFVGGAGILYQDPDNDNQFNVRFADSLGIDPWEAGNLKLLRDTELLDTSAKTPQLVRGYVDPSGVDSVWHVKGDEMSKITQSGVTAVIGVTLNTIFDITSMGATYVIARDNGIFKGVDTAAPSQIYTTTPTQAVIEAVKGRLIYGTGPAVYQLLLSPVGPPAALPTATFTHQDPNWRWRSVTDGPTAIYVAGDSGTTSEIHKFTPSESGGVPALAWAGVTATMPTGETIRDIYQYVGSFVGIATNKGFRVGEIDGNGDISYGPLLFEPDGGCRGIVGFDRFMFVGSANAHDGDVGLFRVDLGQAIQEQTTRSIRYAYARDIYVSGQTGSVTSVTMFGASDRKVFSVDAEGAAREYATQLVPSGTLDTGRIRFNTEEPKLYKFFSVRLPAPLSGDVSVTLLSETGGVIPYITYSPTQGPGTGDVATPQPTGPQNWIALRFTLFRGSDPSAGGVLNGWQVKALPGSIRQRLVTQVFQLFDEETDMGGQSMGYEGFARERFEDFKMIARRGDVVLFQELMESPPLSTQVVIDDWEFRQTGPPGPRGELSGYLTVVMRTVAEST